MSLEKDSLRSYARMEGISYTDLIVDEKIDLSPQKIAALVVDFFDKLAKVAVKSAEMQRNLQLKFSDNRLFEKQIKKNNPWVDSAGVDAKEKWLNYHKNQLFPQEIIDLFEAIEPGQKDAWDRVLADCLLTMHEDEPRMVLFGFLTGLSVSIVQNGESLLKAAGMQNPTALTIASQILISLAGQGIRWKATETYFNIEFLKEGAGKAAADIFSKIEVPNKYKGTNWQNLTGSVLEKFKQVSLDKRLSANIQGLTMGLVSGNVLFGNFDKAIKYGLIALGVNYILGEKYPQSLKEMIKMFIDTQLQRRAAIEKSRSKLKALNMPTILANLDEDALKAEHSRRSQATWKNTFQGSVATLLPSFTAFITNVMDKATLQSQAFTWSVVASAVLERSSSIMSTQDAMLQGEKAQEEILDALNQTLANSERRPPMEMDRDDLEITNEQILEDLIIASVGVPSYSSPNGETRRALELKSPMVVKTGEIGLIIGGVQTGKSTLLKVMSGRMNGNPDSSDISLGETDISRAPRKILQKIFHVIPLENAHYFAARETLARLVTEPNVLGEFTEIQIDVLLKIKNVEQATKNPIIQKFLQFCQQYSILQGENGVRPEWFVGSSYILSGSQQALFNLAIAACFDGARNSKIICADDPTNTLDARTKKEWRDFVAKRLPDSGHKMLIVSNDTYDLDRETGWLAMPNVGSVLDVMSQQAHNFLNEEVSSLFENTDLDLDDDDNGQEKSDEEKLLELFQQTAAEITLLDPKQIIFDQNIYRQKSIIFTGYLYGLSDLIINREEHNLRDIKEILFSVTEHALKVISSSTRIAVDPMDTFQYVDNSDVAEFIAFTLIHGIERFIGWQIGGFPQFPQWYDLLEKYKFDSTYNSMIKAQDEIMSNMLDFLQENTRDSAVGFHWKKFVSSLSTAFNRHAFSQDLRLWEPTQKLIFKIVRSGYFDQRENELLDFLNQKCNPLNPNLTLAKIIFNDKGKSMTEFLALLRYRKVIAH